MTNHLKNQNKNKVQIFITQKHNLISIVVWISIKGHRTKINNYKIVEIDLQVQANLIEHSLKSTNQPPYKTKLFHQLL